MVIYDKNSALSLDIMTIPREEEPTARRTMAGKMLMGLLENLLGTERKST